MGLTSRVIPCYLCSSSGLALLCRFWFVLCGIGRSISAAVGQVIRSFRIRLWHDFVSISDLALSCSGHFISASYILFLFSLHLWFLTCGLLSLSLLFVYGFEYSLSAHFYSFYFWLFKKLKKKY